MQTYIIKSFSHYLLDLEIKKITNNSLNVISFDLDEDTLNNVLEECNYLSLFEDMKYILVKNMKYFSNRGEYKKENEQIEAYLNKENPNTTLIFIVDDLNKKNKNVKLIKDKGNLIIKEEFDKDNLNFFIRSYLNKENYKIESKALELLEKKCLNNLDIIINEIQKLFLVKKDSYITEEDIKFNCANYLEENYDFINAVVTKNPKMLIEFWKLEELKIEPINILGKIISQFKLMYTVLIGLEEVGEQNIVNDLKMHAYRIKLAKENGFKFGISKIEDILEELNVLDLKMKSDYSNKYILIQKFLLDLLD